MAIGKLMYAMLGTCPDIAFAVMTLSHYMDELRTTHWHAILCVFKYLKGTTHLALVLGGKNISLTGYTDADWGSQMHRHSISGYAFFVRIRAISWSSKKQPIITVSTTKSEYVAITHSSKELIWIQKIFAEFICQLINPTTLFSDNQSAIWLTKDSTFHARTKHIDIQFHFMRQTVILGQANIKYCSTEDMIADIFMKLLAQVKLAKFHALLGLTEA